MTRIFAAGLACSATPRNRNFNKESLIHWEGKARCSGVFEPTRQHMVHAMKCGGAPTQPTYNTSPEQFDNLRHLRLGDTKSRHRRISASVRGWCSVCLCWLWLEDHELEKGREKKVQPTEKDVREREAGNCFVDVGEERSPFFKHKKLRKKSEGNVAGPTRRTVFFSRRSGGRRGEKKEDGSREERKGTYFGFS